MDAAPRFRRALITGGAGFIGSTLADRLTELGVDVTVYDNFSTGHREFVENLEKKSAARIVIGDVLDKDRLSHELRGCDIVFHLAANADVRLGLDHPTRDLEQNTVATSRVLEAMRSADVSCIAFASSGSVYGEPDVFPTPEDCPYPVQTSLYGASKLAAEGIIEAYCHGYGFSGTVFRFVSILGERYTHGHVADFYRALRRDPTRLRVLGDGTQEKSYLYVEDCVSAMLTALQTERTTGVEIFNLGTDETLTVDDSVRLITKHMGLKPFIDYTGGRRGWPGDSPLIRLDCRRIRALGWRPAVSIHQGVIRTLQWFEQNQTFAMMDV